MRNYNIPLGYALNFSKHTWFFTGIWVFYYLRFTNYAGIGLIETVLIASMTLFEIPTGAIADLLGKKITLTLSFLFETASYILIGLSHSLSSMLIAVFIGAIGGTLFSGTFDAIVYDSLKEQKKEADYDKILSQNTSIQLAAIIISGLLSGVLYLQHPSLPFFASALFSFIGLILTFYLKEPCVDTLKFTFHNYFKQTSQGFRALFSSPLVMLQTVILLIITGILVIADEMGEGFLGVEFGFSESQIGVFFAFVFLIAAIFSQLTPKLNRFGPLPLIASLGIITAFSFMLSPFVGIIIGGITLIIRQSLATTLNNLTSIFINKNTDSKYRATTISTFNMIKNLPYVFTAFYIGRLMDIYSARNIAFFMGLVMLIAITAITLINRHSKLSITT